MLKYWSNAFMTTDPAVTATSIFTNMIGLGIFIGLYLLIVDAVLNYYS